MSRIEPLKRMGEFRDDHGGVMTKSVRQKCVDPVWRATLKDVNIDGRVKKQGAADQWLVGGPSELGIRSACKTSSSFLDFE